MNNQKFCNTVRKLIAVRSNTKKPSAIEDDLILHIFRGFDIKEKKDLQL